MKTSPADSPPFRLQSVKGFTPYFYIWRWCGIWLMPGDRHFYRVYSVFAQFNCFFLFNFLMLLSLSTAKSLDDIMEVLLPLTTTALVSFKARFIVHKRETLMTLFATSSQMEASTMNHSREQAILKKSNGKARKLMIVMTICCLGSISARFVQTLLSDQRKLMWKSLMPFDWENAASDWPLIGAIAFQITCNYYLGVMYSVIDPLPPYLYQMLEGNLDILANRLSNLGNDVDSKVILKQKLIDCIEYHRLCLKYNQCLYDIFSVTYLVQFIFSGIVICVTAYQLSVVSIHDSVKITFLITYLVNMAMEVFIPCYFGSLVMAKSELLRTSLFQSNWFEQHLQIQSIIKICLSCVQRPIIINTFKGLFPIALPTFVTVCRAAYSLLSCLKGF